MKRPCCKTCGGELTDAVSPKGHKLRWCRRCHARSKRLWRSANPGSSRAHRLVARALRTGALVKGPCAICGSTDYVEAHHHSGYSQPLAVTFLCKLHHRQAHRRAAK